MIALEKTCNASDIRFGVIIHYQEKDEWKNLRAFGVVKSSVERD